MAKNPNEEFALLSRNIESYKALLKETEFRCVMARLQGKKYYQEEMVSAARKHVQVLESRRQLLIQKHPWLFTGEKEGGDAAGSDQPETS